MITDIINRGAQQEPQYYQELLNPGINLCVLPRHVVSWNDFILLAPKYSIALDGVVDHGPTIDLCGKYVNFDHHQGVSRLITASTSLQVKRALKTGLAEAFSVDGRFIANIFVNDPDHDTALAVWLLTYFNNGLDIRQRSRIKKLVDAEDLKDCSAGTYPVHASTKFLEQMAWIFEPYSLVRTTGQLYKLSSREIANVIKKIGERVTLFVNNSAQRSPLDLRFSIIHKGNAWSMVEETGADARTGIFKSGIRAFVACRQIDSDTYSYSIGRLSEFVDFPIKDLYDLLNRAESIRGTELDRWGGSDLIGGSPRTRGSTLPPELVANIIDRFLTERHRFLLQ